MGSREAASERPTVLQIRFVANYEHQPKHDNSIPYMAVW